jgi:hypothetical protein
VVDTLGFGLGPPLNDVRYTLDKFGMAFWWKAAGDSLFIVSSTGESGALIKAVPDANAFAGVGFASYDVVINGRPQTSDTFPVYARPIPCR